MKYLLVPIKEKTGSNDSEVDAMAPSVIMNFITAIILSLLLSSRFFPDMHGWHRFLVCIIFSVVYVVLSFFPIIGTIICIFGCVMWCIAFWQILGGIKTTWLRVVLKIIIFFLIIVFEGGAALMSIGRFRD